ncbi:hypothetical protein F4819DRAFT_469386 [Hypoxylon fuscum]|nr:hypothetical protein F4819DRAFT_469386 [Hypoxylon fuscum]
MAEKPQTEGVVDTHIQVPSPLRAAPQPNPAKNTNAHDDIAIETQPQLQLPNYIQEEKPKPFNTNTANENNVPQIVQEQGPQLVTPLHMLTEHPTWIDCPACKRRTLTRTDREGSGMQVIAGFLLCLVCVCLACLPCIGHWCENIHIYCSSCNARVATIPHDGPIQLAPIGSSRLQPTAYNSRGPRQQ